MYKFTNSGRVLPAFTIIELLIAILIIGILVAITVVSYNGIVKSAAITSLDSSLKSVSNTFELSHLDNDIYPNTISQNIVDSSKDITLKLVPVKLTTEENGYLLYTTCREAAEFMTSPSYFLCKAVYGGYGQGGFQLASGTQYADIEITGVGSESGFGQSYINSVSFNTERITRADFIGKWIETFKSNGGSFPVNYLWDGTAPEPTSVVAGQRFCVEGFHRRYNQDIRHISETGSIENGLCP